MDKYLEILPENALYKRYFEWLDDTKATNNVVRKFALVNRIEATQYCALGDALAIVPTAKDKELFTGQLKKEALANGLIFFKKNSAIGRAWVQAVKESGVKCLNKPSPSFYLGIWGKGTTRLFHSGEKLYTSISMNNDFKFDIATCREMKGSEFHEILERSN